jgi:acetyltransferase-like isoleucine patch superfamily enzyme
MTSSAAVTIDPTAQVATTAVIGAPFRPLLDGRQVRAEHGTVIQAGVWVGQYATIGEGVTIGADSRIEDYVAVQARTAIGQRVVVAGRSWIGIGVTVGDSSVIKGHIGDSARIGAGCRVAGDLIHRQLDPSLGWDDPGSEEPAPIVEDGAFVGWRATVVGGINIGAGAYVCAGAIVTRDVPAGHIASGCNEIVHPSQWRGGLGKSAFFGQAKVPLLRDPGISSAGSA